MSAILVFGIVIVQCRSLQSFTTPTAGSNLCMQPDGTMNCCTSYHLTQNGCQPCIGATGFNCSSSCPPKYFGEKCKHRCQCRTDECDKELGCYKDHETTTVHHGTESHSSTTLSSNLTDADGFFPEKSLIVAILIICGAVVMVGVTYCIHFVRSRTKRKQKRQQNEFSSSIEISNAFHCMSESAPSKGHDNTSFHPKLEKLESAEYVNT